MPKHTHVTLFPVMFVALYSGLDSHPAKLEPGPVVPHCSCSYPGTVSITDMIFGCSQRNQGVYIPCGHGVALEHPDGSVCLCFSMSVDD